MITFIEHRTHQFGTSHVVETLCPNCRASIIDYGKSEHVCWACKHMLPRLYRYFMLRRTARVMYYAKKKGLRSHAAIQAI